MKKHWILFPAALMSGVAVFLIIRFSQPSQEWASLLEEIRESYPNVKQLSTQDLYDRLSSAKAPGPVLIDARQAEEYSVSHLSGARRASSLEEALALLERVEKDRIIAVYCSVGYRSSALVEQLQSHGFTNVYNLEGSIFKWANEGLPVYRNKQPVSAVHPFDSDWGKFLNENLRAEELIWEHYEPHIRSSVFVLTLILIGVIEALFPRRTRTYSRAVRWTSNLGLVVFNGFLVRILFPVLPITFGTLCERNHWGLLQHLSIPGWLQVIAGIFLLDLGIYWQHRAFHVSPLLWKIHRVHHVDLDYDATTGLRFHPIEIILSMFYKILLVLLLGVPFLGVLLFEIILNSCALFNHSNLYIPGLIDKYLRLAIVTPDFHRVHHSADAPEMNMNYGFNFPWWDRIFKSYKEQPGKGHSDMTIGLNIFRAKKYLSMPWLLAIPFVHSSSDLGEGHGYPGIKGT